MNMHLPSVPKRRKPRKLGPPLSPPLRSGLLLVRLAPSDVGMLRFLLEGYDNLAYFTVLERQTALLKLVFSPHRDRYVREALAQIAETIAMHVAEWPCGGMWKSPHAVTKQLCAVAKCRINLV